MSEGKNEGSERKKKESYGDKDAGERLYITPNSPSLTKSDGSAKRIEGGCARRSTAKKNEGENLTKKEQRDHCCV